MTWRTDSLEAQLKITFAIFLLLQFICCGFLLSVISGWEVALVVLFVMVVNGLIFRRIYQKVLVAFRRASVQLEALQHQDYSLFAKPVFASGKVAEFHLQLNLSLIHI